MDAARAAAERNTWEKTDRQLRFSSRKIPAATPDAQTRWLVEHDVVTEFLDAGIGCCWFAQDGESEPVSGDSEETAIARLAAERGWALWDQSAAKVA